MSLHAPLGLSVLRRPAHDCLCSIAASNTLSFRAATLSFRASQRLTSHWSGLLRSRSIPTLGVMISTLLSLAHAVTVASASSVSVPAGEVRMLWAGITSDTEATTDVPDSNSPLGYTSVGGGARIYLEQTSRIPARLGISFSMRYSWTVPRTEVIPHAVVWRFAKPGIKNPKTGAVSHEYRELAVDARCSGEISCVTGWTLSDPSELLPGLWSVEVIENGKVKLRHTFELVKE